MQKHAHIHTIYSTSRKGSLTATTSTPPISRAARRTSRPMRPNLKSHQMSATLSLRYTRTADSLPVDSNLHHLRLFVRILLGMQVSWRETVFLKMHARAAGCSCSYWRSCLANMNSATFKISLPCTLMHVPCLFLSDSWLINSASKGRCAGSRARGGRTRGQG